VAFPPQIYKTKYSMVVMDAKPKKSKVKKYQVHFW